MEVDDGIISLLTIGYFMNATLGNQGNHCIVVYNDTASRPAQDIGNQALLSSENRCQVVEDELREPLNLLADAIFAQVALSSFGRTVKA